VFHTLRMIKEISESTLACIALTNGVTLYGVT
jgi:hypothetical protein